MMLRFLIVQLWEIVVPFTEMEKAGHGAGFVGSAIGEETKNNC